MAPFQAERFLRDIRHVDKDLRLMALFDLRRYLPSAGDADIPNEVVERTLACLSPEERCEEVQNEAANVLPTMVVKCQQREGILLHLLQSVVKASPSTESDAANLHYLCGMAFKKSSSEFAGEARRNLLFWQKQLGVARALCRGCAENLTSTCLDEATREVMYSAVNALVPAYRDALDGRPALIAQAVRDFQSSTSIRHASLTLVEALIGSVDAESQARVLNDSVALLLSATAGEHYVSYLQLCEAELRAVRVAPQPVVRNVFDSVCEHLRHAAEQYDGGDDNSEILLGVLDSLLQLGVRDGGLSWNLSFAAIKDLISFDPYNTVTDADAAGEEAYSDEYDEYYDYGNEVSDSTWKLRMRAVRVFQTLVAQRDDRQLGMQALATVAGTLRDRTELVQLEGVKLLRAVVRRPYAREAACLQLIVDRSTELCGLLESGEERVLTAVTKALEEVFEAFGGVHQLTDAVLPLLLARVRSNGASLAHNAGAVEGLRTIVARVVEAAAAGQPINSAAVELSTQLPALCSSAARSEVAAAAILRVSDTLSAVYALTRAAAIPAALGDEYQALIVGKTVPFGCRVAAAEGVARWIATYGLQLFDAPAAALWGALDSEPQRLPTLRALHIVASSTVLAPALPPAVVYTVESLLTTSQPSNVRVAAVDVLLGCLSPPSTALFDAAHVQRLVQLYAPGGPLSLAACELGEIRALSQLLQHLFRRWCEAGGGAAFYTPYVAPLWNHLATLASAVGFSRNLLDAALEGITSLLAAVYTQEPAARALVERDVADFLTRDEAHLTCSYMLVRCIAAEAIDSFLGLLSTRIPENGHFLLCVGEAGRECALAPRWCTLLRNSVTSKQGEEVRTCGEVALSYSMLNPANAATILFPCGDCAADGNATGRYYYVKAVKEAAMLAVPHHATAFHTPAICGRLLDTFLGAAAGTDLEELYGACVGVLSVFLAHTGATPRIADVLCSPDASLETRVTCMVALRYFISALVERGASVAAYRPIVVQALLQMHRPTNPKESTAPSLPLRSMALRLLSWVLQHFPEWLLCEETRSAIFPNLLVELREDATLQGTIDLSGYTHRVDKGLDCRKLAFEALSTVFWAERQRSVDLVSFCDAASSVVDILVVASSAHNKGDRDAFLNDTAKELLVRFVEANPTYIFTPAQLDALVDKLAHDIKCGASPTDAQKTALLFTVKCVMKLSTVPVFAYHRGFQEVAEVARTSGLLTQSLKM